MYLLYHKNWERRQEGVSGIEEKVYFAINKNIFMEWQKLFK